MRFLIVVKIKSHRIRMISSSSMTFLLYAYLACRLPLIIFKYLLATFVNVVTAIIFAKIPFLIGKILTTVFKPL